MTNKKNNEAQDLIERMEKETGCRVDDNGFDNNAITGLMGAMSRLLVNSAHHERDDFAAGILIKEQMNTTEEDRQRKALRDSMILAAIGINNKEAE